MESVKFHKVVCPNCGAPIDLDNENEGCCEYCGTKYHVEEDPSVEEMTKDGFKEPRGEEIVSDILDFASNVLAEGIEDNVDVDVKLDEKVKKTKNLGTKIIYVVVLLILFIIMEIFNS